MASLPQTMKALTVQAGKKVELQDIPVPALEPNEVLIRVHSVAQNPTDWKPQYSCLKAPGNIIGCDFSGIVVKLGPNSISRVNVGDTVAAFVHGGNYKDRGAFAQYAKADSDLVWKFSPSVLSFEEAATMNCALWTSIQAFYYHMGLDEPFSASPKNEWILIYGGSTSLGLFSTQLAKLSGYKVVTTTSPKNFKLLKSFGANVVINYRDTDMVQQIQKATGNSLKYAFDTISEADTQTACVRSLAPAPKEATPGKVVVILLPNKDAKALRNDVVIQHTLLYTALGRSFEWPKVKFPASPEDRAYMASWMPKLEELITRGQIKPNPVKLWPGGLAAVNEGFQYMREGKVSAEKIVYNVE
ncbi:putative zinc-binding oxidoreductase ToxD [Rhizoctonia solani 123E]|uniref:Putative zinc-binding oxidoreductase ToxD n=1 Tax=Rhizoctonia solani 123E TaxID=1423351 RepID=A0A074S2Y0_9AGAM|nr:putative zinc-binding oxidoreductase ToxD [Rhizoctonia solani 123E]